jgi:hypothetical protein
LGKRTFWETAGFDAPVEAIERRALELVFAALA